MPQLPQTDCLLTTFCYSLYDLFHKKAYSSQCYADYILKAVLFFRQFSSILVFFQLKNAIECRFCERVTDGGFFPASCNNSSGNYNKNSVLSATVVVVGKVSIHCYNTEH